MTAPILPPTRLHAAGSVSAAGVLSDGVNIVEVERTGVGVYLVTLGSGLGVGQRHVSLDLVGDEEGWIGLQTDEEEEENPLEFIVATFGRGEVVGERDRDFRLAVFRTIVPS